MAEIPIEANISEIGGDYYQVKLHVVPHVGDLVKLFSFVAQRANLPPTKFYEVVQVVHDLHDVSKKIPQARDGCHCVTVYVKPSQSKFFKSSDPLPPTEPNN